MLNVFRCKRKPEEMPQESVRFLEKSMNWIFPGCQLFYRDTDADADIDVQKTYPIGHVIRAGFSSMSRSRLSARKQDSVSSSGRHIVQNSMRPYRMLILCAGDFAHYISIHISRLWIYMRKMGLHRFFSFIFLIWQFRSLSQSTRSTLYKA